MAYVALYRKWRPQDFSSLVGQEHISRTLENALRQGKIAHAYLFSGPRGTGKTSTAKILAKALNCEKGPTAEPCNECANCRKINDGSSMNVFEIDAASNRGIDEMRELRETVKFAPVDGSYKVYIIDEVHMLTTEAFNALLKTLEEPPAHVVFILATTEAHKIPPTIHSRCQRYDFRRISVAEIEGRLQKVAAESNLSVDADALHIIAVHADGGLRDALSILDQCSAVEKRLTGEGVRRLLGLIGSEKIESLAKTLAEKNASKMLDMLDELLAGGKAVMQILSELAAYMRDVMVYQATGTLDGLGKENYSKENLAEVSRLLQGRVMAVIEKLHAAMNECKWSPQPRITLEVSLLSLCSLNFGAENNKAAVNLSSDAILEKIAFLEEKTTRLQTLINSLGAPQNFNAPKNTKIAKPFASESLPNAAIEKLLAERMDAPPIAEMEEGAPLEEKDAPAAWRMLLEKLKKDGQMAVYACVSQGRLQSYSGGVFTIAFKLPFLKARTEKSDYRELLEEILHKISGAKVRVKCVSEDSAPPPLKKADSARPPLDEMTAEEKQVLSAAEEIFGDNYVRKEDL